MRAPVRPIPDPNAAEGALGLIRQHRWLPFCPGLRLTWAIEIAMQIFQLTSGPRRTGAAPGCSSRLGWMVGAGSIGGGVGEPATRAQNADSSRSVGRRGHRHDTARGHCRCIQRRPGDRRGWRTAAVRHSRCARLDRACVSSGSNRCRAIDPRPRGRIQYRDGICGPRGCPGNQFLLHQHVLLCRGPIVARCRYVPTRLAVSRQAFTATHRADQSLNAPTYARWP